FSEETARALNTVLNGVTEKGTGKDLGLDDGRQIAGKTGTSDHKRAAWFSGYTPQLATSVWLGGPAGGVEMRDITINGKYHGEVFGADGPGPIWRDAMSQALRGTPEKSLPMADIPDPAPKPDPNATGTGTATGPGTAKPNPAPSGSPR
ncbi:penicillin-binding protein, partial [Streptomyces rubellomurinus subsp. indigoferus]